MKTATGTSNRRQDRQEGVAPPDACCFGLARLGREDQATSYHNLMILMMLYIYISFIHGYIMIYEYL